MGEIFDPRHASIDGLIEWLCDKRQGDPHIHLSDLLADYEIDKRRLVDIACIDLMQRRRMKVAATVEDYVREFPDLATEPNVLDLIDAELCVSRELGEPINLDHYAHRFPALADQVRELVQLDAQANTGITSALVNVDRIDGSIDDSGSRIADRSSNQSGDFSIEVLPSESRSPRRMASLTQHPLDVPDWFIAEQCLASGPGRWLIRGRDSVRGIALALKVTELPAQLSERQSKQILDAGELAAKVRNPFWVPPRIAAIQKRHLGVIRPWLFAQPWRHDIPEHSPQAQLRQLASVAFAVESAHQIGATHGGIHGGNLVIDHEGCVHVLDAGSSRVGLERWLSPVGGMTDCEGIAPLDERKQVDVNDLIRLVASASIGWSQVWATDLVVDLRHIASNNPADACGRIGQTLMHWAGTQLAGKESGSTRAGHQRSWRKRLARWLAKNE